MTAPVPLRAALTAEFIGTAFLLAGVVGSGIMAENLTDDAGLQLFQNAFATAGVDLHKPITASCGSGVTAGVLALALALLGHPDTAVYDGSWSEYGHEDAGTEVISG